MGAFWGNRFIAVLDRLDNSCVLMVSIYPNESDDQLTIPYEYDSLRQYAVYTVEKKAKAAVRAYKQLYFQHRLDRKVDVLEYLQNEKRTTRLEKPPEYKMIIQNLSECIQRVKCDNTQISRFIRSAIEVKFDQSDVHQSLINNEAMADMKKLLSI